MFLRAAAINPGPGRTKVSRLKDFAVSSASATPGNYSLHIGLRAMIHKGSGGAEFASWKMPAMTLTELRDSIAPIVADFNRRRVLVLGDAILDEYLVGECSRISPEAPVPVLRVGRARRVPGGAANTAANIVSLGGRATLIALVGQDEGGRTLVD